MMARDRGEALVEAALEREGAVLGGEVVGEVAQQAIEIGARDQRGYFAHQHRAGTEAFEDEAEPGERVSMIDEPRGVVGVEIDDGRREQQLPLDARGGALALEPLIDDALMRGV